MEEQSDFVRRFFDLRANPGICVESPEKTHYVFLIAEIDHTYKLFIYTLGTEAMPKQIYSRPKGEKAHGWPTSVLFRGEGVLLYSVSIAATELPLGSRFFIKKKSRWLRTLQPYHSELELPEGWGFSATHLYLTYASNDALSPQYQRAFIRTIRRSGQTLVIEGALLSREPVKSATLGLRKFRDDSLTWHFDVELKDAVRIWGMPAAAYSKYRNEYAYKFKIPVAPDWSEFPSSIYSLTLHTPASSTGFFTFNPNFSKKDNLFAVGSNTIYGFIDPISRTLRFEKYNFGENQWAELWSHAESKDDSPICLFGEYTNAARDNAFHLFQHMAASNAVEAYYIIEKGCGIEGRRVVEFGSSEHLKLCISAKIVVFTHHVSYVVPHFAELVRRPNAPPRMFFLQHGVTALKNSMQTYSSLPYKFDAFCVCSEREASFIEESCEYSRDRIAICGFPRFDRLLRLAQRGAAKSDRIVVFPTWRNGLEKLPTDQFEKSDFFKEWSKCLQALRRKVDSLGGTVCFVSHPIIGLHVKSFEPFVHEVVDVEMIQEVLADCACLITDYSSVAFDALYAGRPLLFFTFDDQKVGFRENAFIDVDTDLPGETVWTTKEVVAAVERIWPHRGTLDERGVRLRPLYFDFIDDRNCERAESVIAALLHRDKSVYHSEETEIASVGA